MKVRDNSLCREWERRRRDRLAIGFKTLVEILPNYDPAKIPARIEILDSATQFIKELRLSNTRLVGEQTPAEMSQKVTHLQDEVNKLILRVKQLTALLIKAKISIPHGPSIKSLGKKCKKFSNKLTKDDIENVQCRKKGQVVGKRSPVQNTGQKTTITVVDKITDEPPVPTPKDKCSESTDTTVLKPTTVSPSAVPPPSPKIPPSTFILTPIQLSQIITRINLAPPLQQHSSASAIVSKVIVPNSAFQKIPIKSITKMVPKKVRKCRTKLRLKTTNHRTEFGTQTMTDSTEEAESVNPDCAETTQVQLANISDQTSPTAETSNLSISPIPLEQPSRGEVTEKVTTVDHILTDVVPTSEISVAITTTLSTEVEPQMLPTSQDKELEPVILDAVPDPVPETPMTVSLEPVHVSVAQTAHLAYESMVTVASDAIESRMTSEPIPTTDLKTTDLRIIPPPPLSVQVQSPALPQPVAGGITRIVDFDLDLNTHDTRHDPGATIVLHDPVSLDTEKMSEVIARSIGLMEEGSEETEAELMELGTDWGDVVGVSHSPKSPNSPTQIFLSMFPLLPRECLGAVPVPMETTVVSHSGSGSQTTTQNKSSSFFIESMLPGQNSTFDLSEAGGGTKDKRSLDGDSSLDTILAPLQPLSRDNKRMSDILSLSAFLHSTADSFAMESRDKDKSSGQGQTSSVGNVGSGFHQNQSDLFCPSYNQTTSYLPSLPDPPSSFHHGGASVPPASTNSVPCFNFGHETRQQVPVPQQRVGVITNQTLSHQKKPPVSSHHGKSRSPKNLSSQSNTNLSRMSKPQEKSADTNFPFPYFHHQNVVQVQQSRTHAGEPVPIPKRTDPPTGSTSKVNSNQGQHNNLHLGPPTSAAFQPRFYTSQNPHINTAAGEGSFFNDQLSRPLYPAPVQAPPTSKDHPFYLTSQANVNTFGQNFHQPHQPPPTGSASRPHAHAPFHQPLPEVSSQPKPRHQEYVPLEQASHYGQPQPSGLAQAQSHRTPTSREQHSQKKGFSTGVHPAHAPVQNLRPVNWMTDSSTYNNKKGQNTFSVSKLVEGQHTTYGDAIVRQNRNPWNDLQFGPPNATGQHQAQGQHHYQPPLSAQAQGHSDPYSSPMDPQSSFLQDSRPTHYHPQNQGCFNPPPPHLGGPTSNSISNFNLSSIFPEINDKGQPQQQQSTYYGSRK